MTSKHDGFEEFQDLEPTTEEEIDQEMYEGVVQHACQEAMIEMSEIGQIGELFRMFAEVVYPKLRNENDTPRKEDDVTPVQG